jgi:hypothetical protein
MNGAGNVTCAHESFTGKDYMSITCSIDCDVAVGATL